MKFYLAMLVAVATASMAHAKTFSFSDGSIGDVDVTLTNSATTSGKVDFSIDTSGLDVGLGVIAVLFTVDFDVNAVASGGNTGLPPDSFSDPNNVFVSYGVNEGAFTPTSDITADARLGLDRLDRNETFAGTLQRLDIPLTVTNFTQVAIQVEGEGFFTPRVPVPASLPLLVGGLGLAGFVLRNRKRKAA